jgi:hypothetical protein
MEIMETTSNTALKQVSAPVKDDPVNHPAHYTYGSIEVIDVIEGLRLPFHLGNAVKYIARAGRKDKNKIAEDLKKAIWYLNRYIEYLEKQEGRS